MITNLIYLIIFGRLNVLLVLEYQSKYSIKFFYYFLSNILYFSCSLAQKIPGWVIERIIESTSEKTTGSITVEIFEKYHVVWLLFGYFGVLTYLKCVTRMYESCRTQYHGEVGRYSMVGVK